MTLLDERILEFISEEGWSSPELMKREGLDSASRNRIAERCEVLATAGLIGPIHGDQYELTALGRMYLEGKIDADALPPRDETRPFVPDTDTEADGGLSRFWFWKW